MNEYCNYLRLNISQKEFFINTPKPKVTESGAYAQINLSDPTRRFEPATLRSEATTLPSCHPVVNTNITMFELVSIEYESSGNLHEIKGQAVNYIIKGLFRSTKRRIFDMKRFNVHKMVVA